MIPANTSVTLSIGGRPPVPVLDARFDAPPVQYIRSWSATLPDPKWSFMDSHGHKHRWARTGREVVPKAEALPTLVASSEYVPCDGSCSMGGCEGYDVTVWHCSECGDQVEPGFIPDYQAMTTGIPLVVGPATASLVIADPGGIASGEQYDVVIAGGRDEMTGRAYVGEWRRELRGDGYSLTQYTIEVDLV